MSLYSKTSKLMVHAQPKFCRLAYRNDTIDLGDAFDYASSNGADLQFLEENEIFRACYETEHYHPNLFEVEVYR